MFNKLFGTTEPKVTTEKRIDWNTLTELKQLDDVISESSEKAVFIFKHSTRCNISRMALKQFENHYSLGNEEATAYFLDLLAYRDISNEIAQRLDVAHQSPQLLLIKNGKCVDAVSHSDIDADGLKEKIRH